MNTAIENEFELDQAQEMGDLIEFGAVTAGYVAPAEISVDAATGERVELTPYEKIRFAAEKFGIKLNDPNKSCKKCYGRGYTGIDTKTQIPVACKCITPKILRDATANMSIPSNRNARRILERMEKKTQGK